MGSDLVLIIMRNQAFFREKHYYRDAENVAKAINGNAENETVFTLSNTRRFYMSMGVAWMNGLRTSRSLKNLSPLIKPIHALFSIVSTLSNGLTFLCRKSRRIIR